MSGCSHCMGTGYRLVPNKFGEASMSNDMCHYCGGRGKIEQDEPSDIDIMNDLQRQIDQFKAENADIKHLCVFALYGLGKLSYEQWHTGDWVHDEIWGKYRKIAHEVFEEYGKKYKALQQRIAELEQERRWHPVSEKPKIEKGTETLSVNVILKKGSRMTPKIAYYSCLHKCWYDLYSYTTIEVNDSTKWCYIPEDKDGDA